MIVLNSFGESFVRLSINSYPGYFKIFVDFIQLEVFEFFKLSATLMNYKIFIYDYYINKI